MIKICTKCKEEKELDQYYKKKDCLYGVNSYCKLCTNLQPLTPLENLQKSDKII